jgi:membrane-bound lytic murein transglycosylase D
MPPGAAEKPRFFDGDFLIINRQVDYEIFWRRAGGSPVPFFAVFPLRRPGAAPGLAVCLSVLAGIMCLALAGCGAKQIGVAHEPGVTGSRPGSPYLPADDGKPLTAEEMRALLSVGDFDRQIRNEDMPDVMLHFKYYLHQARRTVAKNVERGEAHLPYIRSVLQRKRLPGDLAYLPFIESGYDTLAKSRTGALGMWQFVRSTGDIYGMRRDWWSDERHCPYQSTEAAAEYLSKLYAQFKDWHLALTSYNAGEGRVSRALSASGADSFFELRRRNGLVPEKDRLTDENQQYLPRFLAVCKIMRNLRALGFAEPDGANARQVSEIRVRPATDLVSMSRRIGMSWSEFSSYNPIFLRSISPPDRATRVFVPLRLSAAAAAFARDPDKNGAGWINYTARKGDTFASISAQTGVPVAELRRVNQIGELKAGKVLRIPRSDAVRLPAPALVPVPAPPPAQALVPAPVPAPAVPNSPAPQAVTYKVQPGDTVWAIARKFDVNPIVLMRDNKLTIESTIRPGDTVRVVPNRL